MNNLYQTKYLKYRAKYDNMLNGGQPPTDLITKSSHSSSVRIKLKVYVNNQFEGEGSVMVNGYPGYRPTINTLYSAYNIWDLVDVPKHLAYTLTKYTKKPLPSKRLSDTHNLKEGNTYYAYYTSMKPVDDHTPDDYITPTPNLDHLSVRQRSIYQSSLLKANREGRIPPPVPQPSVRRGPSNTTLAMQQAQSLNAVRNRR